jgi:hypothetical protein
MDNIIITPWSHSCSLVQREQTTKNFNIVPVLLSFAIGPLACFPSEAVWNYGSYRQLVGLLGRVISPVARLLPTQDNTNTEETQTDMHTSSGIRTHDPSVRASEDISYHRPRGHCDRQHISLMKERSLITKAEHLSCRGSKTGKVQSVAFLWVRMLYVNETDECEVSCSPTVHTCITFSFLLYYSYSVVIISVSSLNIFILSTCLSLNSLSRRSVAVDSLSLISSW